MKTGQCPKCHQRDVYSDDTFHSHAPLTTDQAEQMRDWGEHPVMGAQVPPRQTITYACGACYYTETYLNDKHLTKRLHTYPRWKRVSPAGEGPFR